MTGGNPHEFLMKDAIQSDFNAKLLVNGFKQYLSSPYTRVELFPSRH